MNMLSIIEAKKQGKALIILQKKQHVYVKVSPKRI